MTHPLDLVLQPLGEPERAILLLVSDLVFIIILYVIVYSLRVIKLLVADKRLGKKNILFERSPKKTAKHFLILGDSIAAGVGTEDTHNSLAGRVARDYPEAHINNHAHNGARLVDIIKMLPQLEEQFFDLIIIQIGGNDVLSYTKPKETEKNLRLTLTTLKKISDNKVILVGPLNVGLSSLFWFPINLLYSSRSKMIRNIFNNTSMLLDVPFVDLYSSRTDDPFIHNRNLYFAKDNIHPSDEGYSYIYNRIKETLEKHHLVINK